MQTGIFSFVPITMGDPITASTDSPLESSHKHNSNVTAIKTA